MVREWPSESMTPPGPHIRCNASPHYPQLRVCMQNYLCMRKNKHDWQHHHPFCYISWWRHQKWGPPTLIMEPTTVGNRSVLCESDHRANAAVIFFLKCMAPFSVHVQPFLLVLHSHSQLLDTCLGNAPFKQWLGLALRSITGKTTTSGTHQSCPTGCTNQALCKTASVSQTLMRGQHSGSHFFFFFFTDIRKGLQRNVTSPPVTSA